MRKKKFNLGGGPSHDDKSAPDQNVKKSAVVSQSRRIVVSAAGLVVLAIITAIVMFQDGKIGEQANEQDGTAAPADDEQLELTRRALAETENLQLVSADASWNTLHEQSPEDVSITLNRALNRVLRVDALASQATNAALDAAEKKEARSKLPDAISGARAAIDSFANVSNDPITSQWLGSEVDLHEASLLPGSMTKSIRREVYDRLSKTIQSDLGADPRSMILGGVIAKVVDQMEDPIDGLPRAVLADAGQAFAALSDNHPDNLFFALRAARLNIEDRNPRAADYIKRSRELTSAIEPLISADTKTIGLTPEELVEQIVAAIEANDWATAENRNLLWFNVLNSSEIMKTDRRRAMPHPLDRLNFDSLRELSAKAAQKSPIGKGTAKIQYASVSLADSANSQIVQAIDFDLDLDADLVSADDKGNISLWQNASDGWQKAGQIELDVVPSGMLVADLFVVDSSSPGRLRADRANSEGSEWISSSRHDTFLHLLAYGDDGVRVISIDGRTTTANEERLQLVEKDLGLGDLQGITAAVAGDLEADGDLDLVFATKEHGVRMFINRGNRTFFELPGTGKQFGTDDPISSLAIADLDRDLDLDVITTHASSGRVGILENMLHLQFRGRVFEDIPAIDGAASLAIEDIDGNVSWDLVVGGSSSSAIVFSHTSDAGVWVVDRVEMSDHGAENGIVADIDNDSWMEMIADGEFSRMGPWGWTSWEAIEPIEPSKALTHADFDRDGSIDLSSVSADGIMVMNNRSTPMGHYLNLRFKGIDDNASGRVNHYAIGSVLETRFGPHYRARIVTSPSTHFGLDGLDQAGSVRAILPNGLTQTVTNPPIDSLVEEEQTLKGSCPYLYAWDGEKFAFVTDCLWAAPLGLQVAHGVVAKDRPWEYLKLDGKKIAPKDGKYELRITEELWEVAYFDEVQLNAIDHPADVEIWTNEKVGPDNIATPTTFAFAPRDRHPVRKAMDTSGNDVTAKLARIDQDFVQGFDRRLRQGLCEPHWIDLDFGDKLTGLQTDSIDEASPAIYLVLTGWIMPTDASLNIQIDQNPDLAPIEFPSVWVPDNASESGWKQAIPFMGFPGGKTKTIVVDVTDIVNPDDPRFRVRTSAQIYWDSAEVVTQSQVADLVTQECELLTAGITFHGFSRRIKDGPLQPEVYDYQDASSASRWPPLRGKLSREGDCVELVKEWDDRMAVISGGDEIRLEFAVPPNDPPAGWTRDFVLHSVGWDKDADLNTLTGQQIGPLPFREMKQYPPGVDQTSKTAAVVQLNQNHLGREQTFRSFWFREPNAPPMRFAK
ncbi:FG-GAP-like repeat-containing protein [Aporhodopirellula aestuarii]|uniref:FG-GAP-like repeat-containing protein n=1 Tax=Aporhodopirellula aestuarii TaxID=2950107 RepID=A0ABT0TYM7_9BACT|nr:FG-GAP-like repeat-containing protein [Aporhodopirellula aestuarii]MCM2369694.1 FG-GAP-like repeat-containing protein [Aporhodopirellula aestuarii]